MDHVNEQTNKVHGFMEKSSFINILSLTYDMIKNLEHDAVDPSQKAAQSLDIVNKILELQKKLQQSRAQARKLAGVEYSKQEQLRKLEALNNQLQEKYKLIKNYKIYYPFSLDSPKF